MKKEIYLDNAATTKLNDSVLEYITKINKEFYGNPSSLHKKGIESERIIKEARNKFAKLLDVNVNEIIFTSGGTEANNLATIGFARRNIRRGKHIITSSIEHPSVLEPMKYLERQGFLVDNIRVDSNGNIDLDELKSKISKDTILMSLICVNNEIGTIQNISEIVNIKNEKNPEVVIHLDGVQAFGKIKLKLKEIGIDMFSISGHKINGPKGIGLLYKNKSVKIDPILFGGGQEFNIRSGTENVALIGGFALAAAKFIDKMDESLEYVGKLKEYFIKGLERLDIDFKIAGGNETSKYILSVGFANIKAEVMLHYLESHNIFVSVGSACSSKSKKISHVLSVINFDKKYVDGVLRFSFSKEISFEDLDYVLNSIKNIIPKIIIKHNDRKKTR